MSTLYETAVSLHFSGDTLDPDDLTRLLGKRPSSCERKGQAVQNSRTGGKRVARSGRWRLSVERRSPGDLDTQIAELVSGATTDLRTWRKLADDFKGRVFCGLFLNEWNEGLRVAPQTLKALGDRGLFLDLDVYGRDRESDADSV
ncbi:MAG: DUF4279 domain-containing protein [Pseudomonadota bacterium]